MDELGQIQFNNFKKTAKAINFLKTLFKKRIFLYTLSFLIFAGISTFGWFSYQEQINKANAKNSEAAQFEANLEQIKKYAELKSAIELAKTTYPGIDLKSIEEQLALIRDKIWKGDFNIADLIKEVSASLDAKTTEAKKLAEAEALKGTISGRTLFGTSPVADVKVELILDKQSLASVQSGADGTYSIKYQAGNYTLQASKGGYVTFSRAVELKASDLTAFDISLQKRTMSPVSAPAPTTSDGNYEKITVTTPSNGSFTVYLMKYDLSQYEMIVDTAADGDCENDCPVKSLASYVSANSGVGGIHGTYFCPTAYASCAGKTNSFYYKLYNTRLDKKINWTNGLGDYLPFLMINSSGGAQYFDSWSSAKDLSMRSGISCRPNLVSGGQIVVTINDLDSDKEKYSKISHGFLGLKGQTIYAGIVSGATVLDEGAVAGALGLDYAMNIDGGGTSAMYYNGSYKVGPGRDMPNAVVFKRR